MRLNTTPRVGVADPLLQRELREHADMVNRLAEGRISAQYSAVPSAPTAGVYFQGDFVANSAPTELGTAGSKYVIEGWVCVASGSPGTFVQKRFLTGN
ncbi:hypothetical protein [Pseudomonas multiresinivorans]|uniref:Uncharacterized protein n=1 Tax=Pseudomonas multiresinivorans TaxID=95301 RepID=A0A7Z3GRQ1_9PSED|nr:hypothetical protein [Pseudomonas multiresinivorans]QJP10455.1 hypothetical protein G4G71_22145 [Pseudomonas multiresinivorans]